MIPIADMRTIARARLTDAEALFAAHRYEAAIYLCGYAVEIALKARVCRTLKWPGFPETTKEFQGLASFKTHDLQMLLRLCGREDRIMTRYRTEWSAVVSWNPESRYSVPGTANPINAQSMIAATKVLLRKL